MDTTAIIVALIGGGAGIITAIKGIIEYLDRRKGNTIEVKVKAMVQEAIAPILSKLDDQSEKIDKIEAHNAQQDKQLSEIRLDTTRTQLYFKMEHDLHNHDTILKIAYRYFVELRGDWVATIDFMAWAEKEKVKIPKPILDAIAQNDRQK